MCSEIIFTISFSLFGHNESESTIPLRHTGYKEEESTRNVPSQNQKHYPSMEKESPLVPSKSDQKAPPGHHHFCLDERQQ